MSEPTGIEIDFDVHTWLDSWVGPTSLHDFLRAYEIVVDIDAAVHIAGGERSHFFPCPVGSREIRVRMRERMSLLPESLVPASIREAHSSLFASAIVEVAPGRKTRLIYQGRPGLMLDGKATLILAAG
ncbi:MAG: hypothetical protein ABJE95_04720 [Byssovorax sp.]